MARKRRNSVPLGELQQMINKALATDQSHTPEWRHGLCAALREALEMANNYGGWEFIDEAGLEHEIIYGDLRARAQDKTRRKFFTLDEIEEEAEKLYAHPMRRAAHRVEKPTDPDPEPPDDLGIDRIGKP